MDLMKIIFSVALYVIIFFLIEKVSFKKTDKFSTRVIYAVGFFLIVAVYNVLIALGDSAPYIGVTILQIGIVFCLSGGYIYYHFQKK